MKLIITFCSGLVLCAATARADTIVLRSGDRIHADSVQERNGRIEYSIGDNTLSIPKSIVVRVEKSEAPPAGVPVLTIELPPPHEELSAPGDLASRVVRNGAVDPAGLKAIENENVGERSAAANSIAANFEVKRHNYAAAARYLQAALVYLPQSPALLENYATVLLHLGHAEEALERARQLTRVSPKSPEAFLVLGYALYKCDHNREAVAALKKSLELHPDEAVAALLAYVERESNTEADFRQQESNHFTLRYEGS
ncbi:MAG TPA: tetratricopeptide repeat protein, partial [Candidatus Sulfotelmatobacter sp.]|nr:tetratricopeptide repeat protein [Candidatus Sulfotelmatobacter sp.]